MANHRSSVAAPAFACLVFLGVLAATASAATINVPGTKPTLVLALAAAQPGDTIVLAPGVHSAFDLEVSIPVTLRGTGSPDETIIDAGGQGHILLINSPTDSTHIQGLTFRNAVAAGKSSYEMSGGAIFIDRSAVTITDCNFEHNIADGHGGALRIAASAPLITNCRFSDNSAPSGGGGAIEASFGASPVILDSVFERNWARWGGAVSVRVGGNASLIRCLVVDNTAGGDLGYGGAVFADYGSVVVLINGVMAGNEARFGGAVACFAGSQVNLDHATVVDNAAAVLGGGMLIIDASPQVTGSIFAFNVGAAIGLAGACDPRITCTDLYGNTLGDWTAPLLALPGVSRTLSIAPEFCSMDPLAPDGLRLPAGSPLLDTTSGCDVVGAYRTGCGATSASTRPPRGFAITEVAAAPNPFNPRTIISFKLTGPQHVQVAIHGVRGELVRVLNDSELDAGSHELIWSGQDESGRNVGSGVYIAVVRGEIEQQNIKLTLLK